MEKNFTVKVSQKSPIFLNNYWKGNSERLQWAKVERPGSPNEPSYHKFFLKLKKKKNCISNPLENNDHLGRPKSTQRTKLS